MRRRVSLLAGLWCVAASVGAQDVGPGVAGLAWLHGCWQGRSGDVSTEEWWTAPKGGLMLGLHRDVKGDRAIGFEFLRIQETKSGVTYFGSPMGKPATPFVESERSKERVAFENKAHDFPQRIEYWLDAAGQLHARVEGSVGGTKESEVSTWARTTCDR